MKLVLLRKKKITPIIIGETILPNNKPNFIHSLLKGVNIFELIIPNNKNNNAINIKTKFILELILYW